jgi:hypothetical protein
MLKKRKFSCPDRAAKPSQAKPSQAKPSQAKPSQAKPKVLTEGGDLREAQVDVPLSVSHSCI